jgi:hypothetical protein
LVADDGWLENLLRGKQPWVEVALLNQDELELNPGIPKHLRAQMPVIPAKWQQRKGVCSVPVSEIDELITWINGCLAATGGKPDFRVTGWVEG